MLLYHVYLVLIAYASLEEGELRNSGAALNSSTYGRAGKATCIETLALTVGYNFWLRVKLIL